MTQFFPAELPPEIRDNPGRQAEVRVYDALTKGLRGDWLVMYSLSYLGRYKTEENLIDGEIDFLIGHPELGFLILEVKGGEVIERDGRSWFSRSAGGERYPIRDPFQQAMTSKNLLIQVLKEDRDFKDQVPGAFFCHGVCFPDATELKGSLLFHERRELMLFAPDLVHMEEGIEEIFRFSRGSWVVQESAVKSLMQGLKERYSASAATRRSGRDIAGGDARKILELTEGQYFILKLLENQKRLGIQGCPGSGKTLLALEKARRSLAAGRRTLLLCFNRPLGLHLYEVIGKQEGLLTGTFHSVMLSILIKQLGIPEEEASAVFLDDENLLETMLDQELPQFDTIIVDEAQDFSEAKLALLELMLPSDGEFCLFYDRRQNLSGVDFRLPQGLSEYVLDHNLRNSRAVAGYLRQWAPDRFILDQRVPDGLPTRILKPYESGNVEGLLKNLAREIHALRGNGFAFEDITVISMASSKRSSLHEFYLQGVAMTRFGEGDPGGVTIDSVRRYKGLESPVVIITETDELETGSRETCLKMASAVSRAVSQVLILPDTAHYEYFLETLNGAPDTQA